MSRLDELVAGAREDVERRRQAVPAAELREQLGTMGGGTRPFSEALVRPGLSLIAEFKRRSPSAGEIAAGADPSEIVQAYERGGAAALSILTDGRHFGGDLDDLRTARERSSLPILRKDFIVDPYQLAEASVYGADAVLLIVGALDDDALAELYEEARMLDLDCLVEVHDEPELERALAVGAEVIGINNRDLRDLSVDIRRTHELITDVPAGKTVVSESGYDRPEQFDELERIGVDAVLVGEALMRAGDPEGAVRELTDDEEATREHYRERVSEENPRPPAEGINEL
jgi:indole-3-glycerol phosphate synthase